MILERSCVYVSCCYYLTCYDYLYDIKHVRKIPSAVQQSTHARIAGMTKVDIPTSVISQSCQ